MVKRWLKILVSFGVLGLLFVLLPWQQVKETWHNVSLPILTAMLAGFVIVHFLGVIKWRTIVNANAGRAPLHLLDAVRFYAAGLFANLCLPSIVGGDVLRAALAGKRIGQPEAVVLGGLADRMIDTLAIGVLVAVGGLLAGGSLSGWSTPFVLLVCLLTVGIGVMMLPLLLRRPLNRWPAQYRRRVGRALVSLRRLWQSPRATFRAFTFALVMQSSFVLLNAWLGFSLSIDVPLAVWFLVWPLAKAAGLLPVSLGGLGVRDATLAALLVPFGVPLAQGLVASLAWTTVMIGGGLLGGLFWWMLGRSPEVGREVLSLSGSSHRSHG
jgi:uncharacterized membrane protein YbhN (UPF0104 family)